MSDTHQAEKPMLDRRTMLSRAGALGLIGGAATIAVAKPVEASRKGKSFILDVDTDSFADFQQVDNGGGTGPFYVSGNILHPANGSFGNLVIGVFHCWGWIRSPDGLGVVNQEFDIDGRGKILIAGVESDAPRGVTGGTGDFSSARGQGIPDVTTFDFDNTGKFRIKFRLIGAKGPRIR